MTFARNQGCLSRVASWQPLTTMRPGYRTGTFNVHVSHPSISFSASNCPLSRRISGVSFLSYISYIRPRRMASPSPNKHQLWHHSHGIVFAKNGDVVYPKLPLAGYHSSPDLLSQTNDSARLGGRGPDSDAGRQVESDTAAPPRGDNQQRAKSAPLLDTENPETAIIESVGEGAGPAAADSEVSDEPPFSTLDFKIPEDLFREAKLAEAGSPESFWSYSMYRGPGDDGEADRKVKVHYCKTKHTTERVLQQYFMNEKILGFDLEWVPEATKFQDARRNVSLVQIASPSRIALFHLALYPKTDSLVAPSLKKIMEDPEITKAGVFIKADCTRLRKYLAIDSRGIFELSHLYKLVKYSTTREFSAINRRSVRLAAQVQEYLGLPMFKGQDVRSSDWSQPLGMQQIVYSASDAYAAVQLYAAMNHLRQQLDPTPPLPYHAELDRPIRLADNITIPTVDEKLDPEGEDGRSDSVALSAYLKALGLGIEIEADGEPILKEISEPPVPAEAAAKDARIVAAENWSAEYRASRKSTDVRKNAKAPPASLRAYHIWHHNLDLDPEAIAKLLRNPPLQTATVVNYILEAIRLEKLPFNAVRLQAEVLSLLPKEMVASRYKTLANACKQAITVAAQA